MQRNHIPISESPVLRAKIGELSDDDKDDFSEDEGSNGDDFNGKEGSKDGVGQTGRNKYLVKVGKDITNLDESREICLGLPINKKRKSIDFLPISIWPVTSAKRSMLSEDDNNSSDDKGSDGHDFNSWTAWKGGIVKRGSYILDVTQSAGKSSGDRGSYGHNFNSETACQVGEELRYFYPEPYPMISLPLICPEYITQVHLRETKMKRLWGGIEDCGNLEEIDFSGCEFLEELPDMSKFPKLEILRLAGCTRLRNFPSRLFNENLVALLARKSSGDRGSYGHNFNSETACQVGEGLRYFYPEPFPMISLALICPEYITQVHLRETKMKRLGGGIEDCGNLKEIDFLGCEFLKELPDMSKFSKLEILDLAGCTGLRNFPSRLFNENLVALCLPPSTLWSLVEEDKDVSFCLYSSAKLPKKNKKKKQLQTVQPKVDCDGCELKVKEVPSSLNGLDLGGLRTC
ncbi:hypothetical protein L6164_003172 [Bauhinia variegata]|uniref:Uncharacterized protein n=1 Tax=Bauhinia variegata TaxID=167791 RepID=A0ACB9PZX9_BAUVA|nr:hypothetical protein L6164_003172 [Bauhinia variegata]